MSYAAAVDHLYALGHELGPALNPANAETQYPAQAPTQLHPPHRRKFDLAHMRILAAALGDPQATFPSILIAGTNGKGSTAATLSSILTTAGYRTALYTSPHLSRVNERIQVDGTPIPDDDFARIYFHVDDTARRLYAHEATPGHPLPQDAVLPHHPSFFETLTAIAFFYFAEQKVDIAVLEVGMGGRLDATNIVHPLLSVITDISLDHQDYLGDTIREITREKAGILRPNGTLITLPQHPEANQTIGEVAATLHIHAISAAPYIPHTPVPQNASKDPLILSGAKTPRTSPEPPTAAPQASHSEPQAKNPCISPEPPQISPEALPKPISPNHYTLTLANELLEVDSPLKGQHQQRNIALAIAAAEELRNPTGHNISKSNRDSYIITNAQIEDGIRNTHWPGRLELLRFPEGPSLLLDVAHNPAGAWTLRAVIAQLPESQPRTLLFSCLRDKDLREITQVLLPLFDSSSPDRPHDHILFAPIDSPRATTLDELGAAAAALDIPTQTAPTIAEALTQARAVTPADGIILVTGSIYLVGAIRTLALNGGANPA
ncbi:MAG TPA: Mur ligase family protein [Edaphobacter sp.]